MRHQVAHRKLGRKTAHRKAMFRNMATSLIKHERITTTLHKAKELRKFADQLVTIGKENTLHARRRAFDLLRDRDMVQKLFSTIAPSFSKRSGGYTRIYRLNHRVGDAAQMAAIEYLQEDLLTAKVEGKVEDKKGKKAKAKPAAKKEAKKETKKVAKKASADKKEAKKETKAKAKPAKKAKTDKK